LKRSTADLASSRGAAEKAQRRFRLVLADDHPGARRRHAAHSKTARDPGIDSERANDEGGRFDPEHIAKDGRVAQNMKS
jgi:hypothetical protein